MAFHAGSPEPAARTLPKRRSRRWKVLACACGVFVVLLFTVGTTGAVQSVAAIVGPLLALGLVGYVFFQGRSDRRSFEDAISENAWIEAKTSERLSLARDLHDIVSNGLGSITVRAAVAQRLAPERPQELMTALNDIEIASRRATEELRRMLDLLHQADAPSRVFVGSHAEVSDLISSVEQHGMTISYTGDDWHRLSAGSASLLYQIIREALTNTARYCGPTTVEVTWAFSVTTVTVTIRDNGPTPGWKPEPGTGRGLEGLRRRVEVIAGHVVWNSTDDGGFLIRASLPM